MQDEATQMGGVGYTAQIDESYFHGRRKYNRGRLLQGDKKPIESIADRLRNMTIKDKTAP